MHVLDTVQSAMAMIIGPYHIGNWTRRECPQEPIAIVKYSMELLISSA